MIELGKAFTIRKIIKIIANEERKAAKLTGIGTPAIKENSLERRERWAGFKSLFKEGGSRRDED